MGTSENEKKTADRSDRLSHALERLMNLSAMNWMDADTKLLVFSIRLRPAATTANPETMLQALQAASIQYHLVRLRF